MSPQNWLCRSERDPALDTHGDNAYSPQIPDTKLTVTSKVQFLQLQHVFRQKRKKTQSLTRPTTHAATSTFSTSHNSISSQYSQPFTSFAAPKANPIFHAANKNLFIKTHFDFRHLTSSSSSFYFLTNLARGLTTLSGETTQRKHTYVTPISLVNNNHFPSHYYQQLNPVQNGTKPSTNGCWTQEIKEKYKKKRFRLLSVV